MIKIKSLFYLIALAAVIGLAATVFLTMVRPNNLVKLNRKVHEAPEMVMVGGNVSLATGGGSPSTTATVALNQPVTVTSALPPTEEKPAVKPDETKIVRDPFADLNVVVPVADENSDEVPDENINLIVQGIWGSPLNRYVIINDEILKVGDKIYNYQVQEIQADRVVLNKDGREKVLRIEENFIDLSLKGPGASAGSEKK